MDIKQLLPTSCVNKAQKHKHTIVTVWDFAHRQPIKRKATEFKRQQLYNN